MRIFDLVRLALTVLIVGAGAAVVGCAAHALSVYDGTRLGDDWAIPALWPATLDARGTVGMVVGGAVVVAVGLGCLVLGVVPVVSSCCILLLFLFCGLNK